MEISVMYKCATNNFIHHNAMHSFFNGLVTIEVIIVKLVYMMI